MTFLRMLPGIALLVLTVSFAPSLIAQGRVVIVQTNSAGDSVHLIDPATDKIVGEIPDAEVIHGVAASATNRPPRSTSSTRRR